MTDDALVLEFRQPNAPVSINALKGKHWSHFRKATEPWKIAAWAMARNAKVKAMKRGNPEPTPEPTHWLLWPKPITVQVVLRFRSATRRDPHNYTGTVVKAIVDGLVRAAMVPDDTADWVTVLDPILEIVPRQGHRPTPLHATIIVRPRPEENTP